ncbi:MAG: hypothetical protein K0R38_7535, partial [Polyangiaceae bacterium]|nr:hypothetical protein [Polyangiaceae bacterium]
MLGVTSTGVSDSLNAHASFNRVAALNEAAKELLARSRHVNLLALD